MRIDKYYMKKENSYLKCNGWFISVDFEVSHPLSVCEKLDLKFIEYKKILTCCNANIILTGDNTEHFYFKNEEDINIAIITLKMIIKNE